MSVTVEQIEATLLATRNLGPKNNSDEIRGIKAIVSRRKEPQRLPQPRRGAVYEYTKVLLRLERYVEGLRPSQIVPTPTSEAAVADYLGLELWREAEALVSRPHTFDVLKQLPELRQIISHTAVSAVAATAGATQDFKAKLALLHPRLPVEAPHGDILKQARAEVRDPDEASLMKLLVPQLRLQLAAEVAAGMLCPGQPPPPDTPEHAAALGLFVGEAAHQAASESCDPEFTRQTRRAARWRSRSASVKRCWESVQQEPSVPAPAPGQAGGWQLAPHLDLQMQLPPQRLLQMVCEAMQLQQQQQQQAAAGEAAAADAARQAHSAFAQLPSDQREDVLYLLRQHWPAAGLFSASQEAAAAASSIHDAVKHLGQSLATQLCQGARPVAAVAALLDAGSPADLAASLLRLLSANTGDTAAGSAAAADLQTALLLRFLQQQWDGSNGGTAASWQQAVPLQALVLLLRMQGVHAAIARCLAQDGQQQEQQQQGQDGQDGQQEDLGSDDDSCSSTAGLAQPGATGSSIGQFGRSRAGKQAENGRQQSQAAHQPVLDSMVEVLQLLRRFQEWNAAFDAAAAAGEEGTGLGALPAAASSSSCSSSSSSTVVSGEPSRFFSSSGPLSRGLWGLSEPPGCGLWAAAGAAPAAGSSSRRLLGEAGLARRVQLQQLAWQVALASARWLRRLREGQAVLLNLTQQADYVYQLVEDALRYAQRHQLRLAALSKDEAFSRMRPFLQALQDAGLPPFPSQTAFAACIATLIVCDPLSDTFVANFKRRGLLPACWEPPWKQCKLRWQPDEEQQQQQEQERPGSSSSSSWGNGLAAGWLPALAPRAPGGHERDSVVLESGREAARRLGGAVAAQLLPLRSWHEQWQQQHLEALEAARSWTHSKTRNKLQTSGCTGQHDSSSSKQQQQQQASCNGAAASSGSSSSSFWHSGDHDRHPDCPLCRDEQQAQQQAGGLASPQHTGVFSSPAVAWSDPFMWRRLLWQLLGKLSPAAQAFYSKFLAVCPHCCDAAIWLCIGQSLDKCLWSPAGADVALLQLARHLPAEDNRFRVVHLRQYSRCLNAAFMQTYQPGCTVLARQVLLALSPLHHDVLPAPETAGLCPSSFPALVGKLLQQHLLSRPVLDGFQHGGDGSCSASSSDFWWHIGLRHWHSQQQQQQRGLAGTAVVPALSEQQLEQLYADPDARLFAAGFAMRQLSGSTQLPGEAGRRGGRLHEERTRLMQHFQQLMIQLQHDTLEQGVLDAVFMAGGLERPPGVFNSARSEQEQAASRVVQRAAVEINVLYSSCLHASAKLLPVVVEPRDLLSTAWQQAWVHPRRRHDRMFEVLLRDRFSLTAVMRSSSAAAAHAAEEEDDAAADEASSGGGDGEAWGTVSDAVELLCRQPVPVEALVPPREWWRATQHLLELRGCDGCEKVKGATGKRQGFTCKACGSAVYCSAACAAGNLAAHQRFCGKLLQAHQRHTSAPVGERLQRLLLTPEEPGQLLSGCSGALGWLTPGIVSPRRFGRLAAESLVECRDPRGEDDGSTDDDDDSSEGSPLARLRASDAS